MADLDLESLPGLVNKEVSPSPREVMLVLVDCKVATIIFKKDVLEAMLVYILRHLHPLMCNHLVTEGLANKLVSQAAMLVWFKEVMTNQMEV